MTLLKSFLPSKMYKIIGEELSRQHLEQPRRHVNPL